MTRELTLGMRVILSLLGDLTPDQALIKPDPENWSSLEVLCHLIDEEREDFRKHLEQVFSEPQTGWHAVDPERWVTERRYQDQLFDQKLTEFRIEREKSLCWLKGLHAVDWDRDIQAPFGGISAGSLLASWATHDHLHIRQLVENRHSILEEKIKPFNTLYAGEW